MAEIFCRTCGARLYGGLKGCYCNARCMQRYYQVHPEAEQEDDMRRAQEIAKTKQSDITASLIVGIIVLAIVSVLIYASFCS